MVGFDAAIAIGELDRLIAAQLDVILHLPSFRAMERSWRSLWFVIERVDFDENIQVQLLGCSKDDLRSDFAACASHRGHSRSGDGCPYEEQGHPEVQDEVPGDELADLRGRSPKTWRRQGLV